MTRKVRTGRRQKWSIGDIFAVPLPNGASALGQVVGQEREVLNSVSVAFFGRSAPIGTWALPVIVDRLSEAEVFSVLFVTRDLLDSGYWQVVSHGPVKIGRQLLPHEDRRSSGFIGAKVVGSGIVNEFLAAFYGLAPWDDWQDPHYLDSLLRSPEMKPAHLVLKGPRPPPP